MNCLAGVGSYWEFVDHVPGSGVARAKQIRMISEAL